MALRTLRLFIVLALSGVLAGCVVWKAFWIAPTPTPSPPADALAATKPPVPPTATLVPTLQKATPIALAQGRPQQLNFTDALQYWSNPNSIHDLLYDGQVLWAATYGGLVAWFEGGTYRVYTLQDGLVSQAIAALALDAQGRLWVGYEDLEGWSVREGEAWQYWASRRQAVEANYEAFLHALRTHPRLWSVRPEGTWVWLPRGDGAIQAYDGERWRVYGVNRGVTADSQWVGVSPEGRVWAVGQGISTAEEGEVWWEDHTFFSEMTGPQDVRDIAVDAEGCLWIAFAGEERGGLLRYNLAMERWEGYLSDLNPAIPSRVYTVALDPDGTLWVGGEERLAYRPPFRRFRSFELPGIRVLAFAKGGPGVLWLGSDHGLYRLDSVTGALEGPWLIPSPLPDNKIVGLALDASGRLYVGTPRGLAWIDATGQTLLLTERPVQWLGVDGEGRLWVAHDDGLYLYQEERPRQVYRGAVRMAAFDEGGQVYLCTGDGVIGRLEGGELQEMVDLSEWVGTLPRDMALTKSGDLWLSTAKGLLQVAPDGSRAVYTGEDALLSSDVRGLVAGEDGTLWVATAKGLARHRADGRWTRFTTESTGGGLRSMDLRDVAIDPAGDLWIATQAGVSHRETADADWSYVDVPDAEYVVYDGQGIIWVGTRAGLYRVPASLLNRVE